MSYRPGIGGKLAAALGMEAGPPRIRCDVAGCDRVLLVGTRAGGPPLWLLEQRKAPRWGFAKRPLEGAGVRRVDVCPEHVAAGVRAEDLP